MLLIHVHQYYKAANETRQTLCEAANFSISTFLVLVLVWWWSYRVALFLSSDTLPRSFARFKAFANCTFCCVNYFFNRNTETICIHFLRGIVCQTDSQSVSQWVSQCVRTACLFFQVSRAIVSLAFPLVKMGILPYIADHFDLFLSLFIFSSFFLRFFSFYLLAIFLSSFRICQCIRLSPINWTKPIGERNNGQTKLWW